MAADRPSLLLSYFYFRTKDIDELFADVDPAPRLFADSGAFSAHSTGKPVILDEYMAWLRRWEGHFEVAAALDVIGDSRASDANWRTMRDAGIDCIPVWHVGEPDRLFHMYCEESDYVAIGGMASERWGVDATMGVLVDCFLHARDTGTVLHGFGQTRVDIMADLPWYSVDSTSWQSSFVFGTIRLWDPDKRIIEIIMMGDWDRAWEKADLLRAYDLDPHMIATREGFHHHHLLRASARSYTLWGKWLRDRHGPQEAPGRDPGLHLYLASSQTDQAALAARTVAEMAA